MVMKQIPTMKGTKRKLPNYGQTQNALDEINTILIGGMNKYNLSNPNNLLNEFKISKKYKNEFNTPLNEIVKILSGGAKKLNCKKKINKFQKLQKGGAIKLSTLLKNMSLEEVIYKKCNDPPGKSNIKFITTTEPYSKKLPVPDDIIISLSRFKQLSSNYIKNNTPVLVDETLNIYDNTYYLSAVVIHSGTYEGGHYWTLAKRGKNQWMKLDDKTAIPVDQTTQKAETNGTNSGTNGVLFLYRNKKDITTDNLGNGIENIGNSCYFSSILQFLITTDEYQNPNKMKTTREQLYNFLTETTQVSEGLKVNNGNYLKDFGDGDKKGVKAFNLPENCQWDAADALNKIFDYNKFQYKKEIPILLIENGKESVQKTTLKNQIGEFTSSPPFYKYLFRQTLYSKDTDICKEKTIKPIIESFILKFLDNSTDNSTDTPTLTISPVQENNIQNNSGSPDVIKKPNLKSTILSKGKEPNDIPEIERYNEIEKAKGKGLNRVKLQFDLISETIPELDTGNAIIGEDSVKDLVNQESKMKVMAKTMSGYAESLENDKKRLSGLDNKANEKIKEREKEIEDKMNKINILFKRLFHRREKLSSIPTVWVK